YITGWTKGNIDNISKTGIQDIFLVKYNSSGIKQWTKLMGVFGSESTGRSIAISTSGIISLGGFTSGNLDGQPKTGDNDLFITNRLSP
ncbi:MAG: hypothetical protein N3A58_04755, partial [Spirochaetes bacterium]|nr:hypothetical protein [Spirochaetota bacterium]